METGIVKCERGCRDTCALMQQALKDEQKVLRYYEAMFSECNDPEMRKFITEIMDIHRRLADRIDQRLDEIKARAEALDGVMASFEG